jgi:hypothetical protein
MSGEPIDKGVTTRQPAVALLCVNSADQEQFDPATGLRFNSSTPARIYINNQQPALFGYMTRLALTEVSMEWATPNVNDYNNTLTVGYYNNAGVQQGVVRISIPNGFYTAPLLGKVVADTLNSNATLTAFFGANTFTVAFGGLVCGTFVGFAGQTKIANDSSYTIFTTSALGRFALLPYSKPVAGFPGLRDDLTNMMGLTPTQTANPSYTDLQGGYASLQYTPFVDIVSNLLTKNQNIRDGTSSKANKTSSILARVYLANENFTKREVSITYASTTGAFTGSTDNAIGTFPGTLRREFVYPKQIMWNNTENVDVIDIEVLDAKGNPLFYNPTGVALGANTVQIENTADLFFTLQATEN